MCDGRPAARMCTKPDLQVDDLQRRWLRRKTCKPQAVLSFFARSHERRPGGSLVHSSSASPSSAGHRRRTAAPCTGVDAGARTWAVAGRPAVSSAAGLCGWLLALGLTRQHGATTHSRTTRLLRLGCCAGCNLAGHSHATTDCVAAVRRKRCSLTLLRLRSADTRATWVEQLCARLRHGWC